ncbi:MAG: hypothetical protein ACTS45_00550 [Candidatus Hodgkinia cicadicola]
MIARFVLNLRLFRFSGNDFLTPLNTFVRSLITEVGGMLTSGRHNDLLSSERAEVKANEGKTELSSNENPLGPTVKSIRRSHISLFC